MKNDQYDLSDKDFIEQFIPYKELKKVGFFAKDIKRKDHAKIVERFLHYFGQTKREFILNAPTFHLHVSPDQLNGHFPSKVNEQGELVRDSFHISLHP